MLAIYLFDDFMLEYPLKSVLQDVKGAHEDDHF